MTSNELITNLSKTSLVGIKVGDLTVVDNITTLLELLNMAKNKIAEDALLWLSGETVTMVDDVYEYELSTIPLQITEVYDKNMNIRDRNRPTELGYYQISPNKIKFNNIQDGLDAYVNYYETPPDLTIDEEIIVPQSLLSAMQFYIASKAFEIYKSEKDILTSKEYLNKYKVALQEYNFVTDSTSTDSILSRDTKIWKRGIR